MTTQQYTVEGMHCEACATKIRAALERMPSVTEAQVTLTPPRAVLHSDDGVTFEDLNAAVRSAGDYRLRPDAAEAASAPVEASPATNESLYPLVLVVAYITGVATLTTWALGQMNLHFWMSSFMAAFFLVFSFFKLLDLRGFAAAYQGYDIVAKAWPGWAWVYPFVELALGISYLVRSNPLVNNLATLAVMLVGSVGVFRELRAGRRIRCACLGAVLNLPMTTVTLIEDLGMAAMALLMLLL